MKNMHNRALALILCLALTLGCVSLVNAVNTGKRTEERTAAPAADTEVPSETVSDNEAVYVLTDASGAVKKVIVSDRIQRADGQSSSRQTQEDAALPIEVRFTYRLDGCEIAPASLAGKSGKVEIRIDYKNLVSEVRDINGKQEKLYVPFLTVSALLLDNEHFSNVTVENGKLVNDGSRTVVIGYALPGMNESLALPESVELTIPDHVTITADATDFRLGSVYTLASNDMLSDYDENDPDALNKLVSSMNDLTDAADRLLNGAQALSEGLNTLLSKSGVLSDGVDALCSGADQLATGAGALSTGAGALADGAKDVNNGAAQLASGTGSLLIGVEQLSGGADQLLAGLQQLSSNSAALNQGAEAVFSSLLSAAETQLKANGLSVSSLTVSNYQGELNQVIASLDPDAVYAAALSQVTAAVEAQRSQIEAMVTEAVREQATAAVTAAVRQSVTEQVSAAVAATVRAQVIQAATGMTEAEYEAAAANGMIDEATQAAIEAQIAAQLASTEVQAQIDAAVAAKMTSEEVQALIAQNVEAQMASEEIRKAIADNTEAQVQKAIADTMAGPEVQAQLSAAAEGAQVVIALKTSLDQYNAFYMGVKSYTAGVDAAAQGAAALSSGAAELKSGAGKLADGSAALLAGTASLSGGADELSGGAAKLSDGAGSLAAGTHELRDGLPALLDGITKLRDGSQELRTGMTQFNEEGIERLAKLVTEDAEGLAERLKAIAVLGKAYPAAYTGLDAETVGGRLHFIYRTDAIGE
ncbi:MAG: hypothetical protein IJJ99_04505 [Oscillospiraceae bacterium]|nr:hypothetical protein [Oscillospiraceae bacterium]